MLHFNSIQPSTLELLNRTMVLPALQETRLVGGTSLALQVGHRQSIDIDLFGTVTADEFELAEQINSLGEAILIQNTRNIKIWTIDGIKVDVVKYPYPWLEDMMLVGTIRLAGIKDIVAMKLAAITGRGAKKDFIDIYFLLKKHTLEEMLRFYVQKYHDGSVFMVLKSLLYFEDAESEMDPVMLAPWNWSFVKSEISSAVDRYVKDHDQT